MRTAPIALPLTLLLMSGFTSSPQPTTTPLNFHPKALSLIGCWLSDTAARVVTEFSLDAVEENDNQFNWPENNEHARRVRGEGQSPEWVVWEDRESGGFMRYRVLEQRGPRYLIEYQENGGGSLTTSAKIGLRIMHRTVHVGGKPTDIRVARITSYQAD